MIRATPLAATFLKQRGANEHGNGHQEHGINLSMGAGPDSFRSRFKRGQKRAEAEIKALKEQGPLFPNLWHS
jgi:hypothetical protein